MKKFICFIKNEVKETKALLKSIPALLMTFFVLSLVLMNLLANKSIDTGLSWLALDGGLIVSWLAFLTMDIVVKVYGPKASTRLSIVAMLINLLVSGIFLVAAKIPGAWGESFVDEGSVLINGALNNTISGSWYVLLGSSVAFLVSAIVNNCLNWLIGKSFRRKDTFIEYAARSYGSTFVAQVVDNLVFALLVSHVFFGWTLLQCFTCALTGGVVELLCEVIFSPIGFGIAKKWGSKRNDLENNPAKPSEDVTKQLEQWKDETTAENKE